MGKIPDNALHSIRQYERKNHKKFRLAILHNSKKKKPKIQEGVDIVISCDVNSLSSLTKSLLPFEGQILAITTRGESHIPLLQKVIPQLPYNLAPTVKSLEWATNKTSMRKMFENYDKTITPAFTIVHESSKATFKEIEEKVGFPVVVKPAGLAESLLVSICFHQEELEEILHSTFRKIQTIYKESNGRGDPTILVEQFMEGEMYSIDGYINSIGVISYCPMVQIKTGRSIGFDDFFGYQRITPTTLKKETIAQAEEVATKGAHALKLRNSTLHIELLQTNNGWKIIEIGPRAGGYRHSMYSKSFGINHTMNDIFIRMGKKVVIPKKALGNTAVLLFYAQKEGFLTKLNGTKKAQELKSFCEIVMNKKIGDRCKFAKNGGKSVFNITLFNKDRSKLLADIRRLEKMIDIQTTQNSKKK